MGAVVPPGIAVGGAAWSLGGAVGEGFVGGWGWGSLESQVEGGEVGVLILGGSWGASGCFGDALGGGGGR